MSLMLSMSWTGPLFSTINRIRSSFILWTLGDFTEAYKESKDLLDKLNSGGAEGSFGIDLLASVLYGKVGNFLLHINQIEEGLQESVRGYKLAKKSTNQLFLNQIQVQNTHILFS